MLHTREKPFLCKVCNKRFARKQSSNHHWLSLKGLNLQSLKKYPYGIKSIEKPLKGHQIKRTTKSINNQHVCVCQLNSLIFSQ